MTITQHRAITHISASPALRSRVFNEWWSTITSIINSNGAEGYFWAATEGLSSDPVDLWWDVTRSVAFRQFDDAAFRPARLSAAVDFDGVDDRLSCDEIARLFNGAVTAITGFDNPGTSATLDTVWGANSADESPSIYRAFRLAYGSILAANSTRQRFQIAVGAGTRNLPLTSIVSKGAGPYDLVVRSDTPGPAAAAEAFELQSPYTPISIGTRDAESLSPFEKFTMAGVRRFATDTFATPFPGSIRYFIVCNRKLSNDELTTIRTVLISNGLM